jgi:2,4-dienoyl-CoA reductase-like NADH-dependent reductase (Old Yellow Enzyme family)
MGTLFEPTHIGSLTVANRFVRSATWEGLADDDGSPTPRLIDTACQLARGGVGLIITGHAYVSSEGQAGRWQLAIYSDDFVPGLSEMTASVHALGGRIALQLAHAGSRARHSLTGFGAMGPSVSENESAPAGREMTPDDIKAVTEAFAAAAVRSQAAGFDAVQIHAAHGYLLSQFLSPCFNKRKDEYGGSIENRSRLLVEIARAVRTAVGQGFPMFIKLNSEDFLPGGLTAEEMIETALMLEKNGLDGVEMSGGTFLSGRNMPSRPGTGKADLCTSEAYYEATARRYKEKVLVPLMLVGGIRTLGTAERLVAEGVADYIALSRPLIREPGLIERWKSGDKSRATCISDNGCFTPGFEGQGVYCTVEAREKRTQTVATYNLPKE